MSPRRLLGALGLLSVLATPAFGQASGAGGFALVMRGVTYSACVEFLMDPEAALKQLPDGYRLIPAASFPLLSSVLAREIQGDTVHRGWIPARVCTLEAPGLTAGDRAFTADDKPGSRQVIGLWTIAAARTEAAAAAPPAWLLAELWASDWHVEKVAEAAFIPISGMERSLGPIEESSASRYKVKFGDTILFWDGLLEGRDSSAATTTTRAVLLLDGRRGIRWTAELSATPQWTRYLPGIFRVEGDGDLARALQGSPIRLYGPMEWGGDARLEFSRYIPSGGTRNGG